ncbi:hypothetical protein [Fluviicola taffensis]|uniref:Uncharacterized protein n=1 Tax=Fluviicola taffensis (strain DSM 16823 / NCIMB 13979 / RW262) TaxID=755732 RepID=F2IIV3_FLUTR|nr:hypothetical protein [Fluviicola taffensis]AEA42810.1 hypothetical protein Fluta_0807 [Fluviicola taffensis DSM 16823]
MKKDGINIIGYIEQKFSNPKPVSYSNGNGFELKYSEEDEIRMGLWASDLSVYKNQENVSTKILTKNFLATSPNKYDAFSFSGRYCLIPTCPILDNPSLIVVDTENLTKKELNIKGALMSNQFAPDTEKVLITGYTQIFIFECDSNRTVEIEIPYKTNEIEYAYWTNPTTIRLIVSSRTDRVQRIINYKIDTKEYEIFEIVSPGEVFGFEPMEEITKSDYFCLFNAKGYSSAAVGRLLNQWTFIDFDTESSIYKLRTNVPVSGIFYSKIWKMKGIKTVQQDVEFDFNSKGITGKENTTANIGYTAMADEVQEGKSVIKSNFWSKVKSMWS